MDPLVILLTVVVTILTVLLVIVGVQVIFILRDVRQMVAKMNQTVDHVERVASHLSMPFSQMGGLVEGVKSGFKMAEAFVKWLTERSAKDDDKE